MLRFATRLRRFGRATQGLAAIEFALIAPVMIAMFYGAVELSSALDCDARVSRVASTSADLVAQATSVSTTDMTNIFNAATAILYPYAATASAITVSSLVDDGKGATKVVWSDTNVKGGSGRTLGSTVTIPPGLVPKGSGTSVIMAEVVYTYSAPITLFLGGPVTFRDTFYSRPRRSVAVAHP
jgi:Flp pilus assembly protein TadG